jgi:ABC-type glutathione transport system ATPase component
MGLSALDTVGTGFEGVFSRRNLTAEQKERVLDLFSRFKDDLDVSRSGATAGAPRPDHGAQGGNDTETVTRTIAKRSFAHFTPAQQALLLFLRAIVARSPFLVLDEPAQGMDDAVWRKCGVLLRDEWRQNPEQAVVVVSHYEDSVPWRREKGRVYRIDQGVGIAE